MRRLANVVAIVTMLSGSAFAFPATLHSMPGVFVLP